MCQAAKTDRDAPARGVLEFDRVEKFGHLIWLITRRSRVQIPPLQPDAAAALKAEAHRTKWSARA